MNNLIDICNLSIREKSPMTFKESVIQFFSRLTIILIIIFPSLNNFLNSFGLFSNEAVSHYQTKLYIVTFISAIILSLILFPMKNRNIFSIFIFLALLITYIVIYFKNSEFFSVLFERIDWLGKKSDTARLKYTLTRTQIDNTKAVYMALVLFIITFTFILVWGIMHRYSITIAIALVIFIMVIPMMYDIEPSFISIIMVLCGIMMLYACHTESENLTYKDIKTHFLIKEKKNKTVFELVNRKYSRRYLMQQSLLMALITLMILSCIGIAYKPDSYNSEDKIYQFSNNVYKLIERTLNNIFNKEPNDVLMNDGNFKNAGDIDYINKTMLIVTLPDNYNTEENLYLKGFVSKDYTSDGWIYDNSSRKVNFTTSGVEFRPPFMPYLYSALISKDYYYDDVYTLNIENQYSLSNRIFTTYNTGSISCSNASNINSTYDGEFYAVTESKKLNYSISCCIENKISEIAVSDITRYSSTAEINNIMKYSELSYYNGYINFATNYNYTNNEALYRNYVYSNYLNVPDEFQEFFNENFEDILGQYSEYYYNESLYSFFKFGNYDDICNIVRNYVAKNGSYTLKPGSTPDDKDFVLYFLQENKKGYCMHFASSAALLLRCMGIPARYVEGYVITESEIKSADISKVIYVPDSSAHAWVEIYIAGYGWIPVEFTPGYDMGNNVNKNPNPTSSSVSEITEPSSSDADTSSEINSDTSDTSSEDNSTTTSINPDSSENSDFESDLKHNNSQNNKLNLVTIIIIIILLLIAIIILVILTGRIYMLKQREKVFNLSNANLSVINMFKYSLSILKFYGFGRNINEPYTDYADRVIVKSELVSCANFDSIVQLAMMCKFSQYKVKSSSIDEIKSFIDNLVNEVYSKQNLWGKFKMKYINRLI